MHSFERLRVTQIALIFVIGTGACDESQDAAESTTTSSGGTTHTGADSNASSTGGTQTQATGAGGTQAQNTGAGGTSGVLCGGDPRMRCAVDCDFFACGEPTSSFDEAGCLRDFCQTDSGCAPNERCAFLYGEGGAAGEASEVCISGWVICEPNENGGCSCGGGADCSGYCVPR